jgi:hypothetical protein
MKQLISIVLTALLLVSNTGITYAQHFCGDFQMMSKILIGKEHLSCGMAMVKDHCEENPKEEAHGCCDNQYTVLEVDDSISHTDIHFQVAPEFFYSFVQVFLMPSKSVLANKNSQYKDYHPPPLIKNIPILYASFLI